MQTKSKFNLHIQCRSDNSISNCVQLVNYLIAGELRKFVNLIHFAHYRKMTVTTVADNKINNLGELNLYLLSIDVCVIKLINFQRPTTASCH